ncbi:MAG: PAS domain S-box protein [Thermodesulfovibrionales bacterium]
MSEPRQPLTKANYTGRENSETEIKYRTLFEQSPDGILIIDTDGKILDFNEAAHRQLGFSREEFADLRISDIDSTESPEESQARIRNVLNEGKADFEVKHRTKEGELREVHVITKVIDLAGRKVFQTIWRDITEHKRAEEALKESEEKYRSLVESTDDSIYVVDRNYRYLHINKKHMARMGFLGDEYIGHAYSEFHEDWETRPFTKDVDKVFGTGKSISREYKSKRDNRYFAQTLSPVKRDAGQIVAVTIISKDITERKNMEEKLRMWSLTDELTGLYNRRGFFAHCDQVLKLCQRQKKGAFLLYADLDNLKEINDIFGHPEGDKVLVEAATIFKQTFRESDIIARVGGDEFVVIPVGNTTDALELITTRLRQNIESHNAKEECKYTLSISYGASYYDPQSPCPVDELVAHAETLMYVQKRNRKS